MVEVVERELPGDARDADLVLADAVDDPTGVVGVAEEVGPGEELAELVRREVSGALGVVVEERGDVGRRLGLIGVELAREAEAVAVSVRRHLYVSLLHFESRLEGRRKREMGRMGGSGVAERERRDWRAIKLMSDAILTAILTDILREILYYLFQI